MKTLEIKNRKLRMALFNVLSSQGQTRTNHITIKIKNIMKTLKIKNKRLILKRLNFKQVILMLGLALITLFTSCTSNSTKGSSSCGQDYITKLSEDYLNQLRIYASNPSASTCREVKTVALNYIEALEKCPEFRGILAQSKAAITNLPCN